MYDNHLPKEPLVCTPAGRSRRAGGQKWRWGNLVTRDLKDCKLEEDWSELALDRCTWLCFGWKGVEELNQHLEHELRDEEKENLAGMPFDMATEP